MGKGGVRYGREHLRIKDCSQVAMCSVLTNGLTEKEEAEQEQWGRRCKRLLLLSHHSSLGVVAGQQPFQALRHHTEQELATPKQPASAKEQATLPPRKGHVIF